MKTLIFLVMLVCGSYVAFAEPFSDNFSSGKLDTNKWKVATYKSPDSKPGLNSGVYVAENLDFSQGMLCIKVTQQKGGPDKILSYGGAIRSKDRFGFGTYEFVMRMSSTSPTPDGPGSATTGAISSGFVYYNNSESEIDLEFLGDQNAMWITNWQNPNPEHAPSGDIKQTQRISNRFLGTQLRKYILVWTPTSVKVYIDGTLVASHNNHIPQTPAYIILQHRGTNSEEWGGTAAVGMTRYMYVKSVNFTPLESSLRRENAQTDRLGNAETLRRRETAPSVKYHSTNGLLMQLLGFQRAPVNADNTGCIGKQKSISARVNRRYLPRAWSQTWPNAPRDCNL